MFEVYDGCLLPVLVPMAVYCTVCPTALTVAAPAAGVIAIEESAGLLPQCDRKNVKTATSSTLPRRCNLVTGRFLCHSLVVMRDISIRHVSSHSLAKATALDKPFVSGEAWVNRAKVTKGSWDSNLRFPDSRNDRATFVCPTFTVQFECFADETLHRAAPIQEDRSGCSLVTVGSQVVSCYGSRQRGSNPQSSTVSELRSLRIGSAGTASHQQSSLSRCGSAQFSLRKLTVDDGHD